MEYVVEMGIDMNEMHNIYKEVQQAAYEIIKRKNATYYGIGLSLNRLITAILSDENAVNKAVAGQDLIFVGVVDHTQNNVWTKNIINAMKRNHVSRIVFTNILGIYNEVPGEFGRWNAHQVMNGLKTAIESDQLLADSGLQYTTLRLPWLNDRHEINYVITHRAEPYVGVSGSRRSVADLVLRIIAKPVLGINDSLGLADPSTQGENRPVY